MTVLTCSHCGAPRDPSAGRCAYCGSAFASGGAAANPGMPATGPDADIEALVRKQNLIGAIKLHRQRYGTDLLTAKTAVESMKARLRI